MIDNQQIPPTCFSDSFVRRKPAVGVGVLPQRARLAHGKVAVEAVESVLARVGRRPLAAQVGVGPRAPIGTHADELGAEVRGPHFQVAVADGAARRL
jgi:hypothetical protein